MILKTETRCVECESGDIIYVLTIKDVKNINIRIKSDGRVVVSANNKVPVSFLDDLILRKQRYINDALKKCREKGGILEEYPKQYVSGENYTLLGRNLRLKVEECDKEEVFSDGVFIYLRVKNKDNFRHKELMMLKWQKEYQTEVFKEICDSVYKIFKKYDVEYPEVRIRYMTSRWGSCQPQKGIITLNSKLIQASRDCIEYVVLHEFAHFIYPNHSRQFWDFVSMLMPDWKDKKKELENI